jgi:hypothetical protein
MAYNREGYAPWSLTRKAGVQSATVDGDIEVPQYIQPVLDTGFVDDKGDWKGVKSSDEQFIAFRTDLAIPNSGEILTPSATSDTSWPLDMTGYSDLFIAIKPTTNAGNIRIDAVMGPDSHSFANLRPINPAVLLKGVYNEIGTNKTNVLFDENEEAIAADVWNIFLIMNILRGQKLLQFKITNVDLGETDFETAFMRLV